MTLKILRILSTQLLFQVSWQRLDLWQKQVEVFEPSEGWCCYDFGFVRSENGEVVSTLALLGRVMSGF